MNDNELHNNHSFWHKGWYRFAKPIPSPNFSARPHNVLPQLLVIHSISLPPGQYMNGEVDKLFLNELDWTAHPYYEKIRGMEVSAHFMIARNGLLTQYVSCEQRAWHAGRSSWQGRDECNDWSIGIELEGLEGQLFEDAQYETLASLVDVLCSVYPILFIAGHEHIAPTRKIDPGPGFDWDRLIRMSAMPATAYPPEVQ